MPKQPDTPPQAEDCTERRRAGNILVNPSYQFRFTLWLTLQGALLAGLYTLLFYGYMSENYRGVLDHSSISPEAKAQLMSQMRQALLGLGLLSLLFSLIISLFGLVVSHRTAGPMARFRQAFKAIREGRHYTRVQLRPSDDFGEVAQEFNEMMDSLMKKR